MDRRRHSAAAEVLRAVHRQPGAERAEVARKLSMTSGLITETVARLSALDLLCEHPAPRTGARGRPTTTLDPHPRGPLVVAVAVGHETWWIAVAQLGGTELARIEQPHQRDRAEVLEAVAASLRSVRKRHGSRIRAVAVSVPGTVRDKRLAQAVPGVPQHARTLYVTIGNVMFAGAALAVAGGHLAWGWRSFWLPVAGGVVWTSGNYAAFRASEAIGLARAAGSWTPLNIVVAFVWGAALFGELDHLSGARFAVLGGARNGTGATAAAGSSPEPARLPGQASRNEPAGPP